MAEQEYHEYIKIDGADVIISKIEELSSGLDREITRTHELKDLKKEKYREIVKADALTLSLLADIRDVNELFIRRDAEPAPQVQQKQKRGRPVHAKVESKEDKLKKMRVGIEDLRRSLKKR